MEYAIEIAGRTRQVAITRTASTLTVSVDGKAFDVKIGRAHV